MDKKLICILLNGILSIGLERKIMILFFYFGVLNRILVEDIYVILD